MDTKYLPIKIFEKRKDYDDRDTEGGGDSKSPSWELTGDALFARSSLLSGNVASVSERFQERKKKNSSLPLVVCTTIEEKAIAKSYRSNVTAVFATIDRSNIIGLRGNRCLVSMVTDENTLVRLDNVISDTINHSLLISSMVEIQPFYPYIDSYENNCRFYKVRLINFNDYDLNRISKNLFEKQCSEHGITINRRTKYTSDMTIYRVCIDNAEQLEYMETFESIYAVAKMLPIEASLDVLSQPSQVGVKTPLEGEMYPIVGVLDTGIADIDHLHPWKHIKKFSSYPEEYCYQGHGTFVSGIIEYGDELNKSKYTTLHGVRLFNATVYPDENKEKIYPDELIEHIREAIEQNNDIKIWNLSLGTKEEADLDEFSDFGMALDNIQDENNVLIIKSAGNCLNFTKQMPKNRIAKSADSTRSLVVGALAETQGPYDYAEPNTPSPFTRTGPGPNSIIKPDLVFFGGNAGMRNGSMCVTGVPSFAIDGKLAYDVGTSFSTPWVSRIAAELAYLVKDEFDPLLVRALMIQNAKYPGQCSMRMADKVSQMGFGMPVGAHDILYNSEDEITLILRDTLDRGSFIEMFDFPYPKSLIDENGFFVGQIIVTLITKSLLDAKQAGEYCQSNIDVLFGTYSTEKDRDTSKPTIKNPKGVDEAKNILLDSCYSTRAKGTYPSNGFERECTLVKYGKKFHPVKKYAVDLSDMTPSNKDKYLTNDRKWYLKIEGLYRDFIEHDAQEHDYQLSQEYCLLLTIRDPNGKAPVYDQVSQQLTQRNFLHRNISLRNIIHVDESNR